MKTGGRRADVQQGLPAQEASLFIIRPASVWLAIWGKRAFRATRASSRRMFSPNGNAPR